MTAKVPDRALADYRSPDALWEAINSRITKLVAADARLTKHALQRRFGYERFLARVFSIDGDWVLKGGTALLVRTRSARHSKDIDLFCRQGEVTDAVDELIALGALDLGDDQVATGLSWRGSMLRDSRRGRSSGPPWTS